jgi:UDP-glucose 4-epimerase
MIGTTRSDALLTTLIVGGSGFIGSHLARFLSPRGARRIVVVGRSPVPLFPLPDGAQYVRGDAVDARFISPLIDQCDEIIDLAYATVPKTSFDDPVSDVLANLPMNVSLIRRASERKLRKFVFVSSGGTVYGPAERLPIDEDHPTNPISPYGITKLAVEKYGLMYWRLRNLPFVAVRPGNAYGPGQRGGLGQGFVATALRDALAGRPVQIFGGRGTVRDYIYVEDLAAGIYAALDLAPSGSILNIGTGLGMDNREVVDAISELLAAEGIALTVKTGPARGFDVAANVLDAGRLRELAGWAPRTPFREGLARAWAWMKDNPA